MSNAEDNDGGDEKRGAVVVPKKIFYSVLRKKI